MIITPKDFAPRPYQKIITDFILDNERCGVWAGMGLGKSISSLNALDTIQLIDDRPILVVAPLRVATTTWPDEVRKWNHLRHLTVLPITGSEKERIRALKYDANIYSTNFEQLPWLVEHYGERWPFATVVIDESTKLKGFRLRQGTQRAKALGRVAHTKIKRIVELTGTPAPNGLEDLWGQAWFLDKGARLGRTYDDFKKRWFRKKYSGFGTEPMDHAQEQIQRALRDICVTIDAKDWFDLKDPIVNNIYVDLPAKARALYQDMEKRAFMEIAAMGTMHGIEAVGAAQKIGKCIAGGTELLTSNGWKLIEEWVPGDRLWDGVQWVDADALVCNGALPVVKCMQVTMTPDHMVLTTDGWKTAEEINNADASSRFDRAPVRIPDRFAPPWHDDGNTVEARYLDGSVRLRQRVCSHQPELARPESGGKEVLWMPAWGNAARRMGQPRDDRAPGVGDVAEHEVPVRKSERQGLAKLRRARNSGVQCLAVVRSFLGRYVERLSAWADARAQGQQRQLRARELFLGDAQSSGEQHSAQCLHRNPGWPDDREPSGGTLRGEARYAGPTSEARVGDISSADTAVVYDLVNCGPRHRFTVRGADGRLLIVHNCLQLANGAVYLEGGKDFAEVHDAKIQALEEIVEEAAGMPVLVSIQFKSDLARLLKAFGKDAIALNSQEGVRRAQAGEGKVWLGHPASMGHGVDGLQEHTNIMAFFGHGWNLEQRLQIIERIGPTRQMQAGKDRPMFIHNIITRDSADEMVIERVATKRSVQDILLAAMKQKGYA